MNVGLILVLCLVFIAAAITIPLVLVNRSEKKMKLKKEEDAKRKQQEGISRFELLLAKDNFIAAKKMHFHQNHFAVDPTSNLVNITTANESRTFAYKDLVSYEMVEDGKTITSGSTGNAVAGGVLFGATGAIVGATMKKSTNVCTNMQLRVTTNDVISPTIIYNLISSPGAVKNGVMYTQAFNFAKDICDTLAVIQKQGA